MRDEAQNELSDKGVDISAMKPPMPWSMPNLHVLGIHSDLLFGSQLN